MATLGSPSQRPAAPSSFPSRAVNVLRRRAVVVVLTVVSLALLSVYFKEASGGPLHALQNAGSTILRPFEVGAERVARPFRDAAGWFSGLIHAKSDAAKYKNLAAQAEQRAIQYSAAAAENRDLKALLHYRDGPRFPTGYTSVAARVIARPSGGFVEQVTISAGSNAGVHLYAPVVTAQGLVGQVTKVARTVSLVTLLNDANSAASGLDVASGATGIVRRISNSGNALFFDFVTKDQVVTQGDVIITAGWHSGRLTDIYPKGIQIGRVTSVSQRDTDLYKQVQVQPFVDFGSLESVLVLISTTGAP